MADATKIPEEWLKYISHQRKSYKGPDKYKFWMRVYRKAVESIPLNQFGHNNTAYAKILVDYAKLQALTSEDEARCIFQAARNNVKHCSLVYVAWAQFELSHNNPTKCKKLLLQGKQLCAEPKYLLDFALESFACGNTQLIDEETEEHTFTELINKRKMKPIEKDCGYNERKSSDSSLDETSERRTVDVQTKSNIQEPVKKHGFLDDHKITHAETHPEKLPGSQEIGVSNYNVLTSSVRRPSMSSTSSDSSDDSHSFLLKNMKVIHAPPNSATKNLITPQNKTASQQPVKLSTTTKLFEKKPFRPLKPMSLFGLPRRVLDEPQNTVEVSEKKETCEKLKVSEKDEPDGCISGEENKNKSPNQQSVGDQQKNPKAQCEIPAIKQQYQQPSQKEPLPEQQVASSSTKKQPTESSVAPVTPCLKISDHNVNIAQIQKETQPQQCLQPPFTPSLTSSGTIPPTSLAMNTPQPMSYLPTLQQPCLNTPQIQKIPQQPFQTPQARPILQTPQQPVQIQQQQMLLQSRSRQQLPPSSTRTDNSLVVNGKIYHKLHLIGKGGSSKVYTVFDGQDTYAIKYVNIEDADISVIQGYINEITLLKRLQGHENIIKLYDWEMNENEKVIKMVLEIGSIDLAGYLRKNPDKITTDFIKVCWKRILDAVQVVHDEGIVHSDLKPANFLLVQGNLKLIDFGIANTIQGDCTSFFRDTQIGTLNYMSPEALQDISQSSGGDHQPMMKIGRPSDVWALGCILYLMVYRKTPFQHITNHIQKWQCIMDPNYEIKFPPIDNEDLIDTMKGCLKRNPRERYTIPELKNHPFLTGKKQEKVPVQDLENLLFNCIMQLKEVHTPKTLRTITQNMLKGGGISDPAVTTPSPMSQENKENVFFNS